MALLGDGPGARSKATPPAGLRNGEFGRRWRPDGLPAQGPRPFDGGPRTNDVQVDRALYSQRMRNERPMTDIRFEQDDRGVVARGPKLQKRLNFEYARSPYDHQIKDWGKPAAGGLFGFRGVVQDGGGTIATIQGLTEAEYHGGGTLGMRGLGEEQPPISNRTLVETRPIVFGLKGGKIQVKIIAAPDDDQPDDLKSLPSNDLTFVGFERTKKPIEGAKTKPPYNFVVATSRSLGSQVLVNPSLAIALGLVDEASTRTFMGAGWNPTPFPGAGSGEDDPLAFFKQVPWYVYAGAGAIALALFLPRPKG